MASVIKVDQIQTPAGGQHTTNSLGIAYPGEDYPGLRAGNPAPSAKYLLDNYQFGSAGKPGNGWYWIGGNGVPSILTYCDFTSQGGGWTMWRSYEYDYRLGGYYANDNHQTQQHGFHWFDAPLTWKRSIKSGAQEEFLFYVSSDGFYNSNYFCVVQPTNSSQNFFYGAGSAVTGIPGYGNIDGYSLGQPPYSFTYHMYWWYNTSGFEPHSDIGHIPNSVSSEDAFGYWGSINSNRFGPGKVDVKMVR